MSRLIGRAVENRLDAVKSTDPKRIYVENVRAFFGIPRPLAQFLCNQAVREGLFSKHIGYICPVDQNIIRSFSTDEHVPLQLECEICELKDREVFRYSTDNLEQLEFFRAVK